MNPEAAAFLPPEVKYKDLKAEITSARALKNRVNSLLRITKPGALQLVEQEGGSVATMYERGEFNILKSVRNRKKSMEAAKKGVQRGQMTLDSAKAARDVRKASSMTASGLRAFIRTAEREINQSSLLRAQQYWSNYMTALRSVFGGYDEYRYGLRSIQEKVLALAKLDWDALKDAIDEAPDIEFIYDPIARDAKWELIIDYWDSVKLLRER